ncbi:MAG: DUF1501 domain-containing protein [Betaproteobacteria bacterium]|nr:DUF1501 domain-containing protein [Betaproteobacteria bacterium]
MNPRRRFLAGLTALGALPGSLAWAAGRREAAPDNLLVLVYLKGGNDAYNTFVPLHDPLYRKLRPTLAVARDQLIPFSSTHGFHPALRPLLPAWEANQLALLQGIGQEDVTNQHYRDLEAQFTGASPGEYRVDGWITRGLGESDTAHPLDALAFGDLDIREADPFGPFRGERLKVVNVVHPSEWLQTRSIARTLHLATPPAAALAGTFSVPASSIQAHFPADEFGDALRATAELAAAGRAPRVVHITVNAQNGDHHDAFDTHWDQARHHGPVLAKLAAGLAAFRDAMVGIGRWDRTLVATYDEFGRSPRENERAGTHHGWASTHMVLGGRVKGGLYGEAPALANVFSISGPPPVIDTRALYTTLIERWWGQSANGVFARRFAPLDLLRA